MKWGISLKSWWCCRCSSGCLFRGDKWKPHRRWAAAGAGDCHRQTGGRLLVIALFENSMARLRLDITPALPGLGLALHF